MADAPTKDDMHLSFTPEFARELRRTAAARGMTASALVVHLCSRDDGVRWFSDHELRQTVAMCWRSRMSAEETTEHLRFGVGIDRDRALALTAEVNWEVRPPKSRDLEMAAHAETRKTNAITDARMVLRGTKLDAAAIEEAVETLIQPGLAYTVGEARTAVELAVNGLKIEGLATIPHQAPAHQVAR